MKLIIISAALVAQFGSISVSMGESMPPRRDPAMATREEFALAEADGSNGALILFIARAPETAEAEVARTMLRGRNHPDTAPMPGPDGTIITDFDAARLAGPAALRAFVARYTGHPLALEAARPIWMEDP